MTDDELCGADTNDDGTCKNPGTRSDGRCHHHTEIEEERRRPQEGRPSELEDNWEACIEAAERGLTYEGIARVAGVGVSTLREWRNDNDEFHAELEKARSRGEQQLVERVAEDRPEFILERSYDYVKTERHEVEADVDQTTEHSFPDVDTDDVREFLRYRRESSDED
ncbi:hypothetical protein [Natrialba aegyptia]|uniref:Uncharacterized protein n=1 Tax=Natrialba aegyptia DSM 13077 TaxID=1227491 RepID=M0B3V8_9EURY|nr:hypothetical protein [Natrialba aegyptia]ELZ05581.1 hypothetical protein C480_10385 [Natrialba aegyptia DSM 13077]